MPLLTAVKLAILLVVPDAAKPILVLLFVQLNVDVGVALNVIVPVGEPAQTVRSTGTVSTGGLGLVSVIGPQELDVQPLSVTLIFV